MIQIEYRQEHIEVYKDGVFFFSADNKAEALKALDELVSFESKNDSNK